MTAVAAVVLGGTFAQTLPPSNGTDDTAWLNDRLAGATGYLRGKPGETYRISAPLVIKSDTILDMNGCEILAVGAFASQMLVNYATLNPVAADEDAKCFAGSNVIDFYPASGAAAQFQVGQTVVIDGGQYLSPSGTNPVPLVATVTAVNVDARNDGTTPPVPNTITLDRPAKATTNYWGIRGYNRDRNITVLGGRWIRGTYGFTGLAIRGNSLMFRHIDGFRVDIEEFYSETNVAHYPISAADFTDGWFAIRKVTSGRDGIHLMGPFRNAHVEEINGYCADDMLSLTACDYAGGLTDSAGDCYGLTWGRVVGGTHQQLVKILAGANCFVDGVKGGVARGTADHYPAWVGEDTGNLGTVGGSYGDIDLGRIEGRSTAPGTYSQLFLASPNARRIRADLVYSETTGYAVTTGRGGTGGATSGAGTTAVIDRVELNINGKGPGRLVNMSITNTTIGDLVIDGQYDQVSGASVPLVLGSRVERLDARLRVAITAALASGVKRLFSRIGVDVSALTPSDGDMALNSNASLACGVGLVVYNAAAGKWKNIYTGATT